MDVPGRILASALCLSILNGSLYLTLTRAADDTSWQPKGELARLPLADDGAPIVISIRIGKRDWPFALFTGCPITVFDQTLAPMLGESESEAELAGTKIPLHPAPSMRVQNANFRPASVACADLRKMPAAGIRVYGLLGADCLKDLMIHLDFENSVLLFCDPKRSEMPPGEQVPLHVEASGIPSIKVCFGNTGHELHRLDTGWTTAASLRPELCDLLVEAGVARKSSDEVINFGAIDGPRSSEMYRITSIGLSETSLKQGEFVIVKDRTPCVGMGFLRCFTTTISIGEKVAYFKSVKSTRGFGHEDFDGMQLESAADSDRVTIQKVAAKSPAAKAGIQPGDQVIEIRNKSVENWAMSQVSLALRSPRTEKLPIAVNRNGQRIEIVLPR